MAKFTPEMHFTLETWENDILRRGGAAPPGLGDGRLWRRRGWLGLGCHWWSEVSGEDEQ